MMAITLEQLRQELQNCSSSLRASNFKDLLDYIWQINSNMYSGMFMGVAFIDTNPVNNKYFEEGIYGWYIAYQPGTYPYFQVAASQSMVISEDDVEGKLVILQYNPDTEYWQRYIVSVSNLNQSDVVQASGDATNKVMSQYIVTYHLNRLQGYADQVRVEITNIRNSIYELQLQINTMDSRLSDLEIRMDNLISRLTVLEQTMQVVSTQINNLLDQVTILNDQILWILANRIEEAPMDGIVYARWNGTWVPLPEVPTIAGSYDNSYGDSFNNN